LDIAELEIWRYGKSELTSQVLCLAKGPKSDASSGVTPVAGPTFDAGRRTNFRDKNRELFSGELFSGEELLPENRFLGQ